MFWRLSKNVTKIPQWSTSQWRPLTPSATFTPSSSCSRSCRFLQTTSSKSERQTVPFLDQLGELVLILYSLLSLFNGYTQYVSNLQQWVPTVFLRSFCKQQFFLWWLSCLHTCAMYFQYCACMNSRRGIVWTKSCTSWFVFLSCIHLHLYPYVSNHP